MVDFINSIDIRRSRGISNDLEQSIYTQKQVLSVDSSFWLAVSEIERSRICCWMQTPFDERLFSSSKVK